MLYKSIKNAAEVLIRWINKPFYRGPGVENRGGSGGCADEEESGGDILIVRVAVVSSASPSSTATPPARRPTGGCRAVRSGDRAEGSSLR